MVSRVTAQYKIPRTQVPLCHQRVSQKALGDCRHTPIHLGIPLAASPGSAGDKRQYREGLKEIPVLKEHTAFQDDGQETRDTQPKPADATA